MPETYQLEVRFGQSIFFLATQGHRHPVLILSPVQIHILEALALAPGQSMTSQELHQVLGFAEPVTASQRASLSRSLRRLETWCWIVHRRGAGKHQTRATLTAEGLSLINDFHKDWDYRTFDEFQIYREARARMWHNSLFPG